jgi:hypothetical protein
MTVSFLLYHRITTSPSPDTGKSDIPETASALRKKTDLTWKTVLKKSADRAFRTVMRLVYITVPIYFLAAYLIQHKKFDSLKEFMPEQVQSWLTPEMTAVMTAQFGGLVNAAGVASGFLVHNKINEHQILVAFLLGNILTIPIRTVRRNLPAAMGIFPGKNGIAVVAVLQSLRVTMVAAVTIILVKVLL